MTAAPNTPQIRVLHAEDDPNVSQIVSMYLAHHEPDWILEVTPSAGACLDRMRSGGIDLLLLDLVLPDADGLHVLGELARRHDTTPVVMVSGHGQTELAVRALRAGAVDCIDKTSPQFLQIADVVKRVLATHRTQPTASLATKHHHQVLFVEVSQVTQRSVQEFLQANAPDLEMLSAFTAADFEAFLDKGLAADAVIVGPTPANSRSLDILRRIRSHSRDLPVVILTARDDSETAIAAFKLGAQDILLQKSDYLTELVFSLNNILRRAEVELRNAQLTHELESVNRSLEAQVQARTSELQALSLRLLRVQEEERRAIARELHDQLGQQLTGLRFQLEAIRKQVPPALDATLAATLLTNDEMLRYVRDMTQQLRPRVLDDLGLAPALDWHANLFQRQTNIAVRLDISLPQQRLSGELETAVFRIVQEALTNVARHSHATEASVTLTSSEKLLHVEITDRGCGFDPEARLAAHDSLGLSGLRERVVLANGRLEIFSRIGQGTRIHVEFPLAS